MRDSLPVLSNEVALRYKAHGRRKSAKGRISQNTFWLCWRSAGFFFLMVVGLECPFPRS